MFKRMLNHPAYVLIVAAICLLVLGYPTVAYAAVRCEFYLSGLGEVRGQGDTYSEARGNAIRSCIG